MDLKISILPHPETVHAVVVLLNCERRETYLGGCGLNSLVCLCMIAVDVLRHNYGAEDTDVNNNTIKHK